MTTNDEYPILTQFRGTLNYAKVAETRDGKHGREVRLAEPIGSRMGWFNYDDFLSRGLAESQGFVVYTPEFWKARRSAEIERIMKRWFPKGPFHSPANANEAEYRRLLELPETGLLLKSEIEQAFKVAAKRGHPDAGGSNDEFKQLAAARDVLIERWQH
jgi:hypothetical protein